ncbi:MAG: type I methionyl aminopeptidase [Chloroflexota bacterium]
MTIEGQRDLLGMMEIGRICGLAVLHMAGHLAPGITTKELDAIGAAFLKKHGARSAPILAYRFPGHTCISINDEAAHGIPGDRVIQPGDLVNIDVSAEKNGYWGDTGSSFGVPPVSPQKQALLDATRKALDIAIEHARAGVPISEIGRAVEGFARKQGFQVIEELGGHGVGRHIHEKPSVPHHYNKRARQRLKEGQVITLEPFLTTGARHIKTMPDGWTLKTVDGSLSAQFEHTVVITNDKPILVTAV